jgi:aldehyde:ferredoxin oxidoreductase
MGIHQPWKILRANLNARSIAVQEMPFDDLRQFMGGRAFGAYTLLQEIPAGADPLGPDNKLVFATGVLTHSKLAGASRFSVMAKSPLTGGFGEAEAGGWWGPELVAAGFNAIILEGQSETPVYLWIHDGEAEFCDASEIWGKKNKQAFDWLIAKHGKARIAQIGPAGENLVRYAHILNELHHANGRSGLGAVMGSKKVKAIVVHGTAVRELADPQAFEALHQWHNQFLTTSFYGKYFRDHGTSAGLEYQNMMGGLPTRNFQDVIFDQADQITGKVLDEQYMKRRGTCYGCTLRCKPVSYVPNDETVDPALGGPEYETMAGMGSLLGIADMAAIVKANALANDLGLDTISLGGTIAFAMECFEAGLITEQDTDGLLLNFGNTAAALKLVERIAYRQGTIGELLAEGSLRAARKIGKGAERFAMQVKGQEFPMHDPRTKISQALAYAVCPTGADHNTSSFDDMFSKKGGYLDFVKPLGILYPVPERSLGPEKVRLYTYLHIERSLSNCLLLCNFVAAPMTPLTINKLADITRAVTGWDLSQWEMMKVGERGLTLARLFNIKHGLTSADDQLPSRMTEPVRRGKKEGWMVERKELEESVKTYYGMMGWDEKGVPRKAKLAELAIGNLPG